ncbi:cytochrome P450 CYP72A219-like [Senna tora]|uniref:Cytochrome P450 CYP72A219-like n=1 Tax=Senna tora TaxID=362788 RepID=A0A834X307_9FABA|nr:cytochrome P450 CYP72A219-like [Senna tora]
MEEGSSSVVLKCVGIGMIGLMMMMMMIVNWVWLKPKKMEKFLRKEGFNGNSYRLLLGDFKDLAMAIKEANSKAINFSDDIPPRLLPFLHLILTTYGKKNFLWLGPTPMVNIMGSEEIKSVLNKMSDFPKRRENPLVRILLNGLLGATDHQQWAKHRKIANPAFHLQKLKLVLPAMYESCNQMIEEWKMMMNAKNSCELELDVWPYFNNLSGDVISKTAFGSNIQEGKVIFQLQNEQTQFTSKAMNSFYIPGWRFVPTKMNRRMKEIDNEMQVVLRGIIHKREKAMKAGEAANNDDLLGQETTSALLNWTIVLLSRFPHWQEKARGEINQVFGSNKPDYDGLNRLKVVSMILYEVLRLYPPVPAMARVVRKETKLGNLNLPANSHVIIPIAFIHQDPEMWGDDAKEFKPERFSEGVVKATKGQTIYLPFGGGPRICIGQHFALLEAKMALSLILQNFSFQLSPSYAHAPTFVLTVQPQFGTHIVLHKL